MKLRAAFTAMLLATSAAASADVVRTPELVSPSVNTITTANQSQLAIPGNPTRAWVYCQNPPSATEPLYVEPGADATTASYAIAPGGIWQFVSGVVPIAPVNVMAATAGHAFVCRSGRN